MPHRPVAVAAAALPARELPSLDKALDDKLSMRPLELDPQGYFIIKLDRAAREIVVEHYSNSINARGLAVDDATGEVIGCRGGALRLPRHVFRGRTAKEAGVAILERPPPGEVVAALPGGGGGAAVCSRLEHALYLGRELQRAEAALLAGEEYVQD